MQCNDQAQEAGDELDDLKPGDPRLPRRSQLERGSSVVVVHRNVDEGIEESSTDGESLSLDVKRSHVEYAKVVVHVSPVVARRLAAVDGEHGIQQFVIFRSVVIEQPLVAFSRFAEKPIHPSFFRSSF